MIHETQFIIYVADQNKSATFYKQIFGIDPIMDMPGMTEFQLSSSTKLGIMPEQGIARILGNTLPHPMTGSGIPRCELYLIVTDPEASIRLAADNGATVISTYAQRDWGDLVGYCADPDGHVIAFARHSEQ